MPDESDSEMRQHAVGALENPLAKSIASEYPTTIGFRVSDRLLGRAVYRSDADPDVSSCRMFQPFDVRRRALVGIWIRRNIWQSGAQVVGVFAEDEASGPDTVANRIDGFIRSAAAELGVPIVEVPRTQLGARLAIPRPTDAAIHRVLADQFRPHLATSHPWAAWRPTTTRSEVARYWKPSAVALGAALVASEFFGRSPT